MAGIVTLLVAAVLLLNTEMVQKWLLQKAVTMLEEKLQTKVSIDKVSVSLFKQHVSLEGLEVLDRQQRKMLQMKEMNVGVDVLALLRDEVRVTEAKVEGLAAHLYKPATDSDSVANYQFVIDAFKKDKVKDKEDDDKKKKKETILSVDLSQVSLQQVNLTYNDLSAELGALSFSTGSQGVDAMNIKSVKTSFVRNSRRGPVDTRLSIGEITVQRVDNHLMMDIDSLSYKTNNHLPRKNTGKPHRGFFDAGHLDVMARFLVRIDDVTNDNLKAAITSGKIVDKGSGLVITDVQANVKANKRQAQFVKVVAKMANTMVSCDALNVAFADKKTGRKSSFSSSLIKGVTVLKDIARPFAPVLRQFSMPLSFRTRMRGDADNLWFNDIFVSTLDNSLTVTASGQLSHLREKELFHGHFEVQRLSASTTTVERVINQFPVKKFMMKQLHNLQHVVYVGHFDIVRKKQSFAGNLSTSVGTLNVQLGLDNVDKYLTGSVATDSLQLGKAVGMPNLGKIACKADFRFDISKPRTAEMRRVKGGKLPIGHVKAHVIEAHYGKHLRIRNTSAIIDSDGAVAKGSIIDSGRLVDLLCDFSFTDTDDMQKMKVKPGLRLHSRSETLEERQARLEQKEKEKQARKEQKEKEKEQKQLEKQQKKEEKELRKQQKKQEKEQKKQEKQQKKLQRKMEKEQRKQQAAEAA